MATIASILVDLIIKYHENALLNERGSRLVLPGITTNIANNIHKDLLDYGNEKFNSYLVVEDDLANEDDYWISPNGLISLRSDSFIAITCPNQLSKIPDSIKGSGGATRSDQYTEDWPWIDNKSDSFKFNGVVLNKLLSNWTEDEKEQEWLREFVLECLLKNTGMLPVEDRKIILLEDILGGFSKDMYPEIKDIRKKMLFHVGVPCPNGNLDQKVKIIIKNAESCCKRIVEKVEKGGARESTMEMIKEIIDPLEHDQVKNTMDYFLDKLGPSKYKSVGALAFYDSWDRQKPHEWETLYEERLQRIFVTEIPDLAVINDLNLSCDRSLKPINQDIIATFQGEEINVSVSFQIPPEEPKSDWKIRLNRVNRVIGEFEIPDTNSNSLDFSFLINEELGNLNKDITLTINLHSSNREERRAYRTFKLLVCGENRPAFSVLEEPTFKVVDGTEPETEKEESELIETDIPVKMHLFTYDGNVPSLHDQDNNEYALTPCCDGIFRSEKGIDPTSEGFSEHLKMVSSFGELETVIGIKSIFSEHGEFTLEDELRVNISKNNKDKITKILPIFMGTSDEPYPRLGNIDEKSLLKSAFAKQMTEEKGWRPIIADIGNISGKFITKNHVVLFGGVQNEEFNRLEFSENENRLLEEYQLIRHELLDSIINSLDAITESNQHPVYATHPVYIEKHEQKIEESLVKYLEAYKNILTYVEENKSRLNGNKLFVMLYLDCLVFWNAEFQDLNYGIVLIGPWHPALLTKRYMVQKELCESANRKESEKLFANLTVLLKGIKGISWITGVHVNGNELDPHYVFATSDPGWNVTVKEDIGNKIYDVLKIIDKNLGLEINVNDCSKSELTESSINSFVRSFPSRRSIGINFSKGYSKPIAISTMERILHDGNEVSELGEKIPGGIRLSFDEVTENEKVEIDQVSSNLMLYDSKDDGENINNIFPDIKFLEPREKLEFQDISEKIPLPRGLGKKSVFSEPVLKLSSGAEGKLGSTSIEFDHFVENDPDKLGSAYVNALAKAFEVANKSFGLVSHKKLPKKLLPYQWIVSPGGGMDPAIFVEWVRKGADVQEDRALWDYNIDIGESKNTKYILSSIVKEFSVSVDGFFGEADVASGFITDLGKLGLAIGGEALKTGRNALGAIGIVNTIRLLNGYEEKDIKGVFRKSKDSAGFLVPVDSFSSFFGIQGRRTDLLAIQLELKGNDEPHLDIYACGVESKYVSSTFNEGQAKQAQLQAKKSINLFQKLLDISLKVGGMSERLGLLNILKFGLRISSPSDQEDIVEWIKIEQRVYQSVLRGNYKYKKNNFDTVVVSTEKGLSGAAEYNELPEGMWFRLNKENSPGISESKSNKIKEMRGELSKIFSIQENQDEEQGSTEVTPTSPQMPVQEGEQPIVQDEEQGSTEVTPTSPQMPVQEVNPSEELIQPIQQEVPSGDAKLKEIWLGTDDSRSDIVLQHENLDNLNIMITGSSGSGKTQLLKYIICKIREQQKN
ncbi:MAG: hypothetical protein VX794_08465, partial [Nitrospinota bacterium]|nr:hypothetical protein [Nitrospinota bacterium]